MKNHSYFDYSNALLSSFEALPTVPKSINKSADICENLTTIFALIIE